MINSKMTKAQKWILLGIPVLTLTGGFMHFLYEWTGKITIIGIFAPVNESIWEHLKLTFWPMILWWFAWYFTCGKKYPVSREKWFSAAAASIITCPLVIVAFYYTYTGAFGIESLALDIFSMVLGITLAQFLALHIYVYSTLNRFATYTAVILLILLAAAFTVFTFAPPHIPIFLDMPSASYGIMP